MTSQQLAEHLGLTYRQVDHWVRCGYLQAPESHPGSGHPRTFRPEDIQVAEVMADLVAAGLLPQRASELAHHWLENGGVLSLSKHLLLIPDTGMAS